MELVVCKTGVLLVVEAGVAVGIPTAAFDPLTVEVIVEWKGIDTGGVEVGGEAACEHLIGVEGKDPGMGAFARSQVFEGAKADERALVDGDIGVGGGDLKSLVT